MLELDVKPTVSEQEPILNKRCRARGHQMRRVLEQCAHTTSAQHPLSVLGTRMTETTAKTTEGYL
ncbi:hypothetical protein DPMN_154669 [Dreissena polymorpha]|uniref:Uncharacterized protein n=1 Tax=Dreissena polymorpha TaxID=45954 RepID=A0A9D4FLJ5_DREPO|nr:hypothetical protein DPMN_154669 [Dreissena polymorpha]